MERSPSAKVHQDESGKEQDILLPNIQMKQF